VSGEVATLVAGETVDGVAFRHRQLLGGRFETWGRTGILCAWVIRQDGERRNGVIIGQR
jgi:hypothetical protein